MVTNIHKKSTSTQKPNNQLAVKILVLLTSPVATRTTEDDDPDKPKTTELDYKAEQERRARAIKVTIINREILGVLCSFFQKSVLLAAKERASHDLAYIDLTLALVINLLKVPDQHPTGSDVGMSSNQHLQRVQLDFVIMLEQAKLFETLLALTKQTTLTPSKQNRMWNLRLMEVFTLLFGNQDPLQIVIQPSSELHPALPTSLAVSFHLITHWPIMNLKMNCFFFLCLGIRTYRGK